MRLYEELGLISKPKRSQNGYRIFTELHIEQLQLARLAFQIEILQNGLRNKIVNMIKACATCDFETALKLTHEYLKLVKQEQTNAEEAIEIVKLILNKDHTADKNTHSKKRKDVSDYLNISMDTLRNWEMNGLLTVKRRQNGYRVYTDDDINRLKIIRSLRCANYSLEAILRMLSELSANPNTDIKYALNTPSHDSDIIAVCDNLISSLSSAECNAYKMIEKLQAMKNKFI